MASETTLIGNWGEDLAVEWLRKNKFLIVARNWRSGRYELDIVAQRGYSLHIVEVKTRRISGWTTPEDAMTEAKRISLIRGVNLYLGENPTPLEVQVDFIAVDIDHNNQSQVRYIPDAVQARW
ncbi:MAG: YraN family protein [Rikenellaceae bacterium]